LHITSFRKLTIHLQSSSGRKPNIFQPFFIGLTYIKLTLMYFYFNSFSYMAKNSAYKIYIRSTEVVQAVTQDVSL